MKLVDVQTVTRIAYHGDAQGAKRFLVNRALRRCPCDLLSHYSCYPTRRYPSPVVQKVPLLDGEDRHWQAIVPPLPFDFPFRIRLSERPLPDSLGLAKTKSSYVFMDTKSKSFDYTVCFCLLKDESSQSTFHVSLTAI